MPPRPKIAYLLSEYPGVSHTFFLREIQALRQRGLLIQTASINSVLEPPDGFSSAERAECAQTYYIKSGSRLAAGFRVLAIAAANPGVMLRGLHEVFQLDPWNPRATIFALFYFAEALLLGQWMRKQKCSHLHVHFAGAVATVAMIAAAAWRIPYSMTVHGPDDFYHVDTYYLRRKAERALFVFCISNFCRSQLVRLVAHDLWHKFHVCPLGVDETIFFPEPRPANDSFRLVSVGRLHPSKGQSVLLHAVKQLVDRGFALHLDLIGGGVDRANLDRIVDEEHLTSCVTLHGALSNSSTRALLQGADLFVLSSFAEGVPVALMEAMAKEIACVGTVVGGISELIRSGEEGILVAPSSVEELRDAVAYLIEHPERRLEMAKAGRTKVLAKYNLARNAILQAGIFAQYGLEGGADDH